MEAHNAFAKIFPDMDSHVASCGIGEMILAYNQSATQSFTHALVSLESYLAAHPTTPNAETLRKGATDLRALVARMGKVASAMAFAQSVCEYNSNPSQGVAYTDAIKRFPYCHAKTLRHLLFAKASKIWDEMSSVCDGVTDVLASEQRWIECITNK